MKKLLYIIVGIYVGMANMSCKHEKSTHYDEKTIYKVETNLSPKIILSGEGFDAEPWHIMERMEFYHVPAVSMVFFEDGKIKWTRYYGSISHSDSISINENTLFQAASISKPVTAIGVLKLVEKGKLNLDIPVNEYLTNWKIKENGHTQKRKVTTRDLLSHTSGMTVTGFNGYNTDDRIPMLIEVLNGVNPANSKPVEVDTIPGSVFKYSGGGYTVLQKLIEDISGNSFKDYMTENVLKTAGMEHSFFDQPLPKQFEKNAASGHDGNGKMITGKYNTYPELAAAGLWTTPSDLAKWAIMVQKAYQGQDTTLLSSELTKEFLANHMNNWGLGIIRIEGDRSLWFTHGGSNLGYRCTMLARLEDGQGAVIMTNGNRGAGLYNEILRSFSTTYDWDIFKPETKNVIRLPKGKLEQFVGQYGHLPENKFQVNVKINGDFLEVTQLWNNIKFPIYPINENDFFEGEEGVSFDFKQGENGDTKELVIVGDWVLTKLE